LLPDDQARPEGWVGILFRAEFSYFSVVIHHRAQASGRGHGVGTGVIFAYTWGRRLAQAGFRPGSVATSHRTVCQRGEILKPEKLKDTCDSADEIWRKFHPDGVERLAVTLPWGNHFGSSLSPRPRYERPE